MIISVSKILIPTQACLQVGIRIWDTPKHEEEVGQGPHEFRMFGRIAGARSAEQSVILLLTTTSLYNISVPNMSCKTSSGCLLCNDRSGAQTEVGQGPHEFRMFGRIAGARSAEQSVILLLTTTSLYNISVKNPYSHAGLPEQSVILLLSDTTIIYNLCSGSFGRSCTTRSERCGSYFKEDYSCSFCSVCRI